VSSINNLSVVDILAVAISWAGAAAIVVALKPLDFFVAIVGTASVYYLAKWIILKEEQLSAGDVSAILLFWSAMATMSFLVQDDLVSTICIAAAYYLSKWVIRKEVEGPVK